MTDVSTGSTILRYLKDEVGYSITNKSCVDHLTPITQGPAVAQLAQLGLKHDLVSFARSVMVSDTQNRLVDPTFPPELRLQVMKAGVPRSTSCNLQLARSWRTVDDLRNLAYNMLLSPPRDQWYQRDPWADQETTDNIRSTAKQAFLETVMFKIDLTTSFATLRHHSASSASPPLLRATGAHTAAAHMQQLTFGARIHHLHLSITVFGNHHYGCVSVIACQGAIECMDSLKLHFPNLKACILTFNIHTTPSIVAFNQHTLLWKATFFDPGNTANALGTEISRLFDAFATNGPGKPKFVQI
jgi:hypothetical protein